MKTKNLYYHAVVQRINVIKVAILLFFLAICSWPRQFIEVFTRKHFGERYFSFTLCIIAALVIAIYPVMQSWYDESIFSMIWKNITWYAYLVAFVIYSHRRYLEVKREPGVYDFERFTKSPGIINPGFYRLDFLGIKLNTRVISIYIEPAVFFLAGAVLAVFKQNLGYLLMGCSVIYGLSWAAQYYIGDQFIMDTIDEMICNNEFANSFVHNRGPEETKGFEVFAEKPKNMDFRRQVAMNIVEDETAVDVL